MRVATWNINNRVGKVRFRPEAATAVIQLDVDVIVLTEFYPEEHEEKFRDALSVGGMPYQAVSHNCGEIANRVLVVSRKPLLPMELILPNADLQFPSNILGVSVAESGLNILAIRLPWYKSQENGLLRDAWDWLVTTASTLDSSPSLLAGDFNVSLEHKRSFAAHGLRRLLETWHRAEPEEGASYYGHGSRKSEIDHILGTPHCKFTESAYLTKVNGLVLAGQPGAISDHAALICTVEIEKSWRA